MEWVLLGAGVTAAVIATFALMTRASRGYEKSRKRRESGAPERPCSTCGSFMEYAGLRSLGPQEGAEELILEMYRCPTCRKVEFFAPPAALD